MPSVPVPTSLSRHSHLVQLSLYFGNYRSVWLAGCLSAVTTKLQLSHNLVPNRPRSGRVYRANRYVAGATLGFNGALRLELRDPAAPGGQSLVDNRLCQSWYEQ